MGDEVKPPPAPIEPTVAELRAEIEKHKTVIAGMVPSAERDALKKELEGVRAELAGLKALPAPEQPAARRRLLDHLVGLDTMFGGGR